MKKEVIDILQRERAIYEINDISYLIRDTSVDELTGNKRDILRIEFIPVNGNARIFQHGYEIKSREFSGIIEECIAITEKHFKECLADVQRDIKNGYNPTRGGIRNI